LLPLPEQHHGSRCAEASGYGATKCGTRIRDRLPHALVADAAVAEPAVRLLAVSEFGRRLQENGSRGTDHGSASVALLLGDGLREGLSGRYPSLRELDGRGDLVPGISPPDLYRQVV